MKIGAEILSSDDVPGHASLTCDITVNLDSLDDVIAENAIDHIASRISRHVTATLYKNIPVRDFFSMDMHKIINRFKLPGVKVTLLHSTIQLEDLYRKHLSQIATVKAEIEYMKMKKIAKRQLHELDMDDAKFELEKREIQNRVLVERAKAEAEFDRIKNAATVEAMNDARIDEQIRVLMSQKSTAKKATSTKLDSTLAFFKRMNAAQMKGLQMYTEQKKKKPVPGVPLPQKKKHVCPDHPEDVYQTSRSRSEAIALAEVQKQIAKRIARAKAERDKELFRQSVVKETMLSMGALANADSLAAFRRLQDYMPKISKQAANQQQQIAYLNRRLDKEEADNVKLEAIIANHSSGISIGSFIILMIAAVCITSIVATAINSMNKNGETHEQT